MAIYRADPYPNANFVVQIGTTSPQGDEAGILEVIFPSAQIFTYEYRNGNEALNSARSLQSITRYGRLILKRGANGSLDWFQWWQAINQGTFDRRLVTVGLLDEQHNGPVLTWLFANARPVNYWFANLNALSGEVLVENLELAFDSMNMR